MLGLGADRVAVGLAPQTLGDQLQEEVGLGHHLPRPGVHPAGDELAIVDAELALQAAVDHDVVLVRQHRVDLAGDDLEAVALQPRRRACHHSVPAILPSELAVLQALLGLRGTRRPRASPAARPPR